MENVKELVIKETDSVLEYRDSDRPVQVAKRNRKEERLHGRLALYGDLIKSDQFKRPETKEVVLDEDDYLTNLERIIQRDYFPQLYAKREEVSSDFKQLNGIEYENPLESVRYDNMAKVNLDYLASREKGDNKVDINDLNVNSYCLNYISDEIESLKDVLFKDRKARLKKNFWMYEQQHKANKKHLALKEYTECYLKLPDKDHQHITAVGVMGAEYDTKNSLFFPPELSNTNNKRTLAGLQLLPQANEIDDNSININSQKEVLKDNTRLPDNFLQNMIDINSQKVRRKIYESYENSDIVKLMKELNQMDTLRNEGKQPTPMINGYKLIKEPTAEDIMKGIPMVSRSEISSICDGGKGFSIPETTVRETLALSLATKSLKRAKPGDIGKW
jgi:hypothetical protein